MADPDLPPPAAAEHSRRDRARLIGGVVVAVVALAFILSNTQKVKIHWVLGTTQTPMIIALAVTLLLGIGLGWFAARQERRRG
jgi:uncharacterized integral membrane protein